MHDVVVDIAEAEGQVRADIDEVAPGQARDHVALRRQDAAQRRHIALLTEDLPNQLALGPIEHRLLEIIDPFLELLDLGPVVIDHRIDDAMKERHRPLGHDLIVPRDVVVQLSDRT